jgi:hypothetical protein
MSQLLMPAGMEVLAILQEGVIIQAAAAAAAVPHLAILLEITVQMEEQVTVQVQRGELEPVQEVMEAYRMVIQQHKQVMRLAAAAAAEEKTMEHRDQAPTAKLK